MEAERVARVAEDEARVAAAMGGEVTKAVSGVVAGGVGAHRGAPGVAGERVASREVAKVVTMAAEVPKAAKQAATAIMAAVIVVAAAVEAAWMVAGAAWRVAQWVVVEVTGVAMEVAGKVAEMVGVLDRSQVAVRAVVGRLGDSAGLAVVAVVLEMEKWGVRREGSVVAHTVADMVAPVAVVSAEATMAVPMVVFRVRGMEIVAAGACLVAGRVVLVGSSVVEVVETLEGWAKLAMAAVVEARGEHKEVSAAAQKAAA